MIVLCSGKVDRDSVRVVKYHVFLRNDRYGTLCIRENPGCLFIATNRDAVTHLTDAQEWAGSSFCSLSLLQILFHDIICIIIEQVFKMSVKEYVSLSPVVWVETPKDVQSSIPGTNIYPSP